MMCPDGCGLEKPEISAYEPGEMTAQQTRDYAASRIRHFLNQAAATTDPLAIEAAFFSILGQATSAFRQLHDLNELPKDIPQ